MMTKSVHENQDKVPREEPQEHQALGSLDGASFHYACPLATDGDFPPRNAYGNPEANCCPPNALRMIASVPGYIFSTSDQGLWIHLYDNCSLDWHLEDETPLHLRQITNYPWDGQVTIELSPGQPTEFGMNLRIPNWCTEAVTLVSAVIWSGSNR